MNYPFTLTMRFKTETDRLNFINFWVNGGDETARMTTLCHPEKPSWLDEAPSIYTRNDEDAACELEDLRSSFGISRF